MVTGAVGLMVARLREQWVAERPMIDVVVFVSVACACGDGAGVRYRELNGAVRGRALLWRVRCRGGCQDDRAAASTALSAEGANAETDEAEDRAEVEVDGGVARLFEGAVGRGEGVDMPDGGEGLRETTSRLWNVMLPGALVGGLLFGARSQSKSSSMRWISKTWTLCACKMRGVVSQPRKLY